MNKVRTTNISRKKTITFALLFIVATNVTGCATVSDAFMWLPRKIWNATFGKLEVKPNEWQDNLEIGPRRAPADNPGSGGPLDQSLKSFPKKTGNQYPYPDAQAGGNPMAGTPIQGNPMAGNPMGDPMNPANFPPDPYANKKNMKNMKAPIPLPPPPGKFQPMGSTYPKLSDDENSAGTGVGGAFPGGDMGNPDSMPPYMKHHDDSPQLIRKFEQLANDVYLDEKGRVITKPAEKRKKSKSEIAVEEAMGQKRNTGSMFPLDDYTPQAKKSSHNSSMFPLEEYTPKSAVPIKSTNTKTASGEVVDKDKANSNIKGLIDELDQATSKQAKTKKPDVDLDKRFDDNNAKALGVVDPDTQAIGSAKLTKDIEKVDTKGKKGPIDEIVIGEENTKKPEIPAAKEETKKASLFDIFSKKTEAKVEADKPAEKPAEKVAEKAPAPAVPAPAQVAAPAPAPAVIPEPKIAEQKPESKPVSIMPVGDLKPAELKTAEPVKAPEQKAVESKVVEAKPAEVKSTYPKLTEAKPAEPEHPGIKSAELTPLAAPKAPEPKPEVKKVEEPKPAPVKTAVEDNKPIDITNDASISKKAAPEPAKPVKQAKKEPAPIPEALPVTPAPIIAKSESIKLPDNTPPPPPVVDPRATSIKNDQIRTGLLPKSRYTDRRRSENF